jgi:hypothetical protein
MTTNGSGWNKSIRPLTHVAFEHQGTTMLNFLEKKQRWDPEMDAKLNSKIHLLV